MQDASVFSVQWLDFPLASSAGLTPEAVFDRYLLHIRRFTVGIIRPRVTAAGVELRLLASSLSLITFAPPELEIEDLTAALLLRICGGFLVQQQQCHRGEFRFAINRGSEALRVTVQLSDYCPLILGSSRPSGLRKWLYRLTQAFIHKLVTIRFLARLYREIVGTGPALKVMRVSLRSGEDT